MKHKGKQVFWIVSHKDGLPWTETFAWSKSQAIRKFLRTANDSMTWRQAKRDGYATIPVTLTRVKKPQ